MNVCIQLLLVFVQDVNERNFNTSHSKHRTFFYSIGIGPTFQKLGKCGQTFGLLGFAILPHILAKSMGFSVLVPCLSHEETEPAGQNVSGSRRFLAGGGLRGGSRDPVGSDCL